MQPLHESKLSVILEFLHKYRPDLVPTRPCDDSDTGATKPYVLVTTMGFGWHKTHEDSSCPAGLCFCPEHEARAHIQAVLAEEVSRRNLVVVLLKDEGAGEAWTYERGKHPDGYVLHGTAPTYLEALYRVLWAVAKNAEHDLRTTDTTVTRTPDE